jgi:hypothetical protein
MNKQPTFLGRMGGLFDSVIKKTPLVGLIRAWTEDQATNSKAAREILRLVVYVCLGLMIYIIKRTFDLAGKMDTTTGTVIGGAFTLLLGVLTVTIPAFAASLNATDITPPTSTNTPLAYTTTPPIPKDKPPAA